MVYTTVLKVKQVPRQVGLPCVTYQVRENWRVPIDGQRSRRLGTGCNELTHAINQYYVDARDNNVHRAAVADDVV